LHITDELKEEDKAKGGEEESRNGIIFQKITAIEYNVDK
jgi:hypothetical protein